MNIDKNQIKKLFLDLVKIDSPSGHEQKVSDFIKKKAGQMGVKFEEDNYGNLIGYVKGKGKPILLCAHMDTVEPGRKIKPVIQGDVIKSAQETILGADDKAGITEILLTIDYLRKHKIKHRPLEIIFTRE